MKLIFRETDGITGDRLTFGEAPIDDGQVLIRDGRYIKGNTVGSMHDPVTVVDSASIDFTLAGQQITADVIMAGITHNLLSATHPDTSAANVVRGDVIVGNATPVWQRLPIGANGTFLRSDGTDASWSTIQNTDIAGVQYWSRAGTVLSPTTAGDDVTTNGNGVIGAGNDTDGIVMYLDGTVGTIKGESMDASGFNPIEIRTGASPSGIYIDTNGSVGINTTTPSRTLEVNGIIGAGNDTDGIFMYLSGAVGTILGRDMDNTDYNALEFRTGASPSGIYIDTSGRVGIGTTTPTGPLHVKVGDGTGSHDVNNVYIGDVGDGSQQLRLGINTAGTYSYLQATKNNVALNELVLNPLGGRVGINTTTPSRTLEVNGWIGAGNDTDGIVMYLDGTVGTIKGESMDASGFNPIEIRTGASPSGIYIDTSGRVGIGTNTPGTAMLDVDAASGFAARFTIAAQNAGIYMRDDSDNLLWKVYVADADLGRTKMIVSDAGADKIVIDTDGVTFFTGGNVAINKTSASRTLEVNGWIGAGNDTDGIVMYLDGTVGTIKGESMDASGFNPIEIRTGASPCGIYIDTSGRVGIGTTTPSRTLEVNGIIGAGNDTDGILMYLSGAVGTILGRDMDSDAYNALEFRTGASPSGIYINTDGDVGIGTNTPGVILDVNAATGHAGRFTIANRWNGLYLQDDSSNVLWYVYPNDADLGGTIMELRDAGSTKILLDTDGNSYFNGGNIGIGTDTPGELLEIVNGSIDTNNGNLYSGNVEIDDNDFATIVPDKPTGILLIYDMGDTSTLSCALIVSYATTPGPECLKIASSCDEIFAVTTGVLDGWTGANGYFTISTHNNGQIYLENRWGHTVTMSYTFLGGG